MLNSAKTSCTYIHTPVIHIYILYIYTLLFLYLVSYFLLLLYTCIVCLQDIIYCMTLYNYYYDEQNQIKSKVILIHDNEISVISNAFPPPSPHQEKSGRRPKCVCRVLPI